MRVLVVDDNRDLRVLIQKMVQKAGHECVSASCAKEAMSALDAGPIDVVFLDYRLPGLNGIEILREMKGLYPDLDVVMVSSFGTIPLAVDAMKHGATDYLSKPLESADFDKILKHINEKRNLEAENRRLKGMLDERFGIEAIKGASSAMKRLRSQIRRVAESDAPVLITGESGTGKELAARAIHQLSRRSNGPFTPVNCPALAATLAESELFGYVKGAFTGADRNRRGLFLLASSGTLFFDEIADMSLQLQAKILRSLETGVIRPVGSEEEESVDVRFVFATNRDLAVMVPAGRFRNDLYYRINVVNIHIPPLREHPEDIPELADHFLKLKSGGRLKGFRPQAMRLLERYSWPGNVRELEHVMERAAALSRSNLVDIEDLPPEITRAGATFAFSPTMKGGALQNEAFPLLTLAELEMIAVMRTLEATGGDKSRTARILGINRATLYRKIRKYGLDAGAGPTDKTAGPRPAKRGGRRPGKGRQKKR